MNRRRLIGSIAVASSGGQCCLLLWMLLISALPLPAAEWAGSKVCGNCHGEIYRKYASTPMAITSGAASSAAVPEQSFSANSGYRYSIVHRDRSLVLEFGKERRELAYFVGSGAAARSYLMAVDGFLYEAPATYYSRTGAWAPSPGYDRYSYPFLTRAIAPGCLQCHATGVQPITGTQNGYQSPPFLEAGVGCERCHGPGAAHAASGKRQDIVNPAALPPEERNSVCAQCHLSGEIRVDRAGKSMTGFTAGDKLSSYTTAFVRATSSPGMNPRPGIKVTSHVEDLAQSACSRASGDRLWCGSCHDPHFAPPQAEKAAWFRSKCQNCHAPSVCRRGDNCISCHMPGTPVTDADHVVYTDHSIPRRAVPRNRKPAAGAPLAAFGGKPVGPGIWGLPTRLLLFANKTPSMLREHLTCCGKPSAKTPTNRKHCLISPIFTRLAKTIETPRDSIADCMRSTPPNPVRPRTSARMKWSGATMRRRSVSSRRLFESAPHWCWSG